MYSYIAIQLHYTIIIIITVFVVIAELLRAEGAPVEHPFLRRFGNPSSRVNFVMMSPYERCPSVRTDSGGGGGESQGNPNGGAQECHLFLAG